MAHFLIENLSFSYAGSDRRVLDDIQLEIHDGEYVCICGKSGCGKSTLLRHLKTVLTPAGTVQGTVLFDDVPLSQVSLFEQSQLIGFVLQDPDSQIVTDLVWHELAFGLENIGIDTATIRLRVAEMASYFGISKWLHSSIHELSGGQKQLLNLASIMAMHPSVLILDEPTSQLDPIAASDFLNTIKKINLDLGTTVIMVEQRLEEVFPVADRVVVMSEGEIQACGSPREVGIDLLEHDDPMTAALPSPIRIYFEVCKQMLPQSDSELMKESAACIEDCPLTVREGRTWLHAYCREHNTAKSSVPLDDGSYEACDQASTKVKNVWFRYEREGMDILRGVDMLIPANRLLAIVGGNGSGKTTLLKCMCGLLKPYRGSICFSGGEFKARRAGSLPAEKVALLPQSPQNLFASSTVRLDLMEMLEGRALSPEEIDARISNIAEACCIANLLDSHPFDLSGGELQRAALAKVLLAEPNVLLLDEPTKGIDAVFKLELANIFDKLKKSGTTIVMVTHDIEFCARYADSVAMLFDGEITACCSPYEFFSQNSFYTTAANRMSRGVFPHAVTDEDVVERCLG